MRELEGTIQLFAALKFCFKTCVAMKFVDDDDDDDENVQKWTCCCSKLLNRIFWFMHHMLSK